MNKPVRNSHNFFIVTLINFPSILFFIAHAISKSKHKKLQICEKKFHCGRLWKLRQIKNRKAKALIGIKRSLLRGETITITCEKLVFFFFSFVCFWVLITIKITQVFTRHQAMPVGHQLFQPQFVDTFFSENGDMRRWKYAKHLWQKSFRIWETALSILAEKKGLRREMLASFRINSGFCTVFM